MLADALARVKRQDNKSTCFAGYFSEQGQKFLKIDILITLWKVK
jgi:hypothetical protein